MYFARDVVVQVPSSVRVLVGGSATIEARLENLLPDEENAVVWSLAQGSPGEFTQVGPLAVEYRAPKQIDTPATAKLTARSVADPFATADVVIEIPEVSVSVKAEKATARPGEEVGLSAEVTNGTSGGVQWFVAGPGAVDEARAVYKALQAVTEPTDVRVRAVSVEDPTKSGEAVIRLLPEAVVTAFGPEAPIPVGATAVLKAEVRYVSDTRVRWQLVSGPGQVDEQTGLYTAVAPIRTPAEAVVRAVSVERPNAYADVTVRIARLVVKVVPESQQVRAGESVRFSASVVNCTSGAVRWSVKSGPGTVSNDGLYTAPAELAQPGAAVVRVESVEDPGAYAEAVIGLLPRPTLTVEPASADLRVGEAVRFAVHLQYLGGGVLWSISDGVGSVSEDGVFTAPEALPDGVDRVKVVVRATAAADPSLTAEANVTVRQVRITAMPARYEVNLGESVELKAGVSGALPGMEGVLWRIVRGVGQVDERSGVYTAPAVGRTPAEVVLQAVSADDPRVSAEVEVVIRQVQVQAAPSGVKLRQGESVALTAEVKNCTNRAVRWQVVEGEGTVDTDGRYTAPPKVGQPTQAVVRAVSTADESAYADAVVYIRPPVTVSVVPAEVELSPGESAALRAQVGYADEPSVTWELVSGPGALTEDGVYTAPLEVPEPFTAVVRARSKEDPSAWADAEISVRGSPRLELFPEEAETELGGEVRFEVGTANLPSGAELVWSVVDGPGKIAGGMYEAPDTAVTPTSARVRVSVEGLPALSREALVRIREVNVVASAEPDILNQGDRVHLTAVVTGARNLAVEWSVASGPGRVSADGVYEAPEELAGDTEAFVTATSAADRTKQAVVRLRLMRAWVEVRPKEVSVQLGGTAQFSAVVHGVQVQAVRWSVQGVGSIHDSGLYTAPLTGSTPDEVLVTAESTAKGGLRGTAKVVIPEVKVSVEPKTAEVSAGGETVRLTAVVMGAADTGVTWYLESGPDAGSIDSDGLYRSPANPGYSGVAVLRAVSRADPSKWGAAQVLIRPQPVPVAGNPWPMFLHDARHSGLSSAVGPDDPVVKWKVPLLTSFSSPAVAEDGAMYIGTTDRSLVAVSPLGEVQWSLADTGGGSGWVRSSPAIGPDGTVYVAERAGALAAVSPDGRVRWRVWLSAAAEAGGYSSPAVAEDGTVYAVGTDTLFALSPDGKELWRRELGGFTASSPAVGPDGTVYVGCDDGAVYAIGPDGAVRWRFWTAGGVRSSPVVGDDGTVYFGSSDGNGYAVSADGKERWRIATGAEVVAAAALGPDGRVYLASSDGFLYAVSADGQLLWRFGSGGPLVVAPVVDAKGTVYVAGGDRKLYAVRPDGGVRWVYETDGLLNSSPVIAGPGLMYLPSGDGYVHVLGTRGDTDGDGRVTVVDAVVALRIALGIQAARRGQVELADVSPEGSPPGDGRLTVQDATVILRRAVGIR
ncbi:MAG: outer membrane protein assembly factor BamB family protein [Armatimonadota bacterium]